ncbi:hypothetical protein [Bacillus subtilis]|nr:hypothetical protein [Bacillus subtilis]ADV94804.1 hypothetical protein BSn5_10920 [Bacillus subtilis BSn5]
MRKQKYETFISSSSYEIKLTQLLLFAGQNSGPFRWSMEETE